MAKKESGWSIKVISEPIPRGTKILHRGPLIITADIGDDVAIDVQQGGVSVRPDANGKAPQIGNNVTLASLGVYTPNVSGPNSLPRGTLDEIKAYRESLRAYFERYKNVPDVPVSGIVIDDKVEAGFNLKLSSSQDPHGDGIRCINTGANLRVRTDRPFYGGNAIHPTIKASRVNMGAVIGNERNKTSWIDASQSVKLDSATYGVTVKAGSFILVRDAQNCTLQAPLVGCVTRTDRTEVIAPKYQTLSFSAFEEGDANLPPERKPEEP